jgi:hypothetical protein
MLPDSLLAQALPGKNSKLVTFGDTTVGRAPFSDQANSSFEMAA